MKKMLKNSYMDFLWLVILILGYAILYIKSSSMGEDSYKVFQAFQEMLFTSSLFWIFVVLIIFQGAILNFSLKRNQMMVLIMTTDIISVIVSIIFLKDILREIDVRQQVYQELDMGWSILPYKLPCIILTVIAIIIVIFNTVKIVKNCKK